MEILIVLFVLTLIATYVYVYTVTLDNRRTPLNRYTSAFFIVIYICSAFLFLFVLMTHSNQYNIAIDPIDPIDSEGYTPFSWNHFLTLFTFYILSIIGIYKLWKHGKKQPPLLFILYVSYAIIGMKSELS